MPAREVKANGTTGTMIPYKKMSVNTAVATVMMMKVLEERKRRKRGAWALEPVSQVNIIGALWHAQIMPSLAGIQDW